MQKGFSLILILIGALVLGVLWVGGYYIYQANKCSPGINVNGKCQGLGSVSTGVSDQISSQKSSPAPVDETANWKTYKSEKYKYQLSYPSNWNQQPICFGKASENDDYVCFVSPDVSLGNTPGYLSKGIAVSVYGDFQSHSKIGLSATEFCKSSRLEPVLKCEEIKVGSEIGWKRYLEDRNQITMGITEEDKIHLILEVYYSIGEKSTTEDTLNKLLATFKFLK